MIALPRWNRVLILLAAVFARAVAADVTLTVDTTMAAPAWARLQRELLAEQAPACREFYEKHFDQRGFLKCFVRWGANDGPDDAFENFNGWPELHALGADDVIRRLYEAGHEGLLRQYTEARTVETPIAREGMYHREFIVQSDWMHHGEGLQLFHRMNLSLGADERYADRARRFAGFYMGTDPAAPNYDPSLRLIRSMLNGSRGPMLRPATALDWVGDPFDVSRFVALHGEKTYAQFLQHYEEYTDVAGDHFLNLVATTPPTVAYLVANEPRYREWLTGYMDAWLERMRRNGGVIPSHIDPRDGSIGGPEGKWWGGAYGWGFSPVNPVTGKREDRNRIPRAMVGFMNAVLVSGEQRYADAWRGMIEAVNANAREFDGRRRYPTMFGKQGWYGWKDEPWKVGALELWYLSMRADDRARLEDNGWLAFLAGRNPSYPETALETDRALVRRRTAAFRADDTPPERRLADNMLAYNPAAAGSLIQQMLGGLVPGREGGLLHARLRYFDPATRRAGIPPDVAALVSELGDTRTVVTLINLNPREPRTLIVQGGAYGEHRIESATLAGKVTAVNNRTFNLRLAPGAGAKLELAMRRYAATPTLRLPWER